MMKKNSLLLLALIFSSFLTIAQNSNKVTTLSNSELKNDKSVFIKKKNDNTVQWAPNYKSTSINNKSVQSNNEELKRLLDSKVIRWAKKPIDSIQLAERNRLLKAKVIQWAPNKTNRSSQLINEN